MIQEQPHLMNGGDDVQNAYTELALWNRWWDQKDFPGDLYVYNRLMQHAEASNESRGSTANTTGDSLPLSSEASKSLLSNPGVKSEQGLTASNESTRRSHTRGEKSLGRSQIAANISASQQAAMSEEHNDELMRNKLEATEDMATLHGVDGLRSLNAVIERERENPIIRPCEYIARFNKMFPMQNGKRVLGIVAPPVEAWRFAWEGSDGEGRSIKDLEEIFGVHFLHTYVPKGIFEIHVRPTDWEHFFRSYNTVPGTKKLEKAVEFLKFWLFANQEGEKNDTAEILPFTCWERWQAERDPLAIAFKRKHRVDETGEAPAEDREESAPKRQKKEICDFRWRKGGA